MGAGELSWTRPPWPFKALSRPSTPSQPLPLFISQHLPICWAAASQLNIWLASSSWLFSFFRHTVHLYEESTLQSKRIIIHSKLFLYVTGMSPARFNSNNPEWYQGFLSVKLMYWHKMRPNVTKEIREGLFWHLKKCLFDLWPRATANTNT